MPLFNTIVSDYEDDVNEALAAFAVDFNKLNDDLCECLDSCIEYCDCPGVGQGN